MNRWAAFILIAFFVLAVYSPSLMDGPRSDQLGYLAELEVDHKTSLWDLTVGSMDLNRHNHLYPGDESLFRPLLYTVLGLEVYFFGFHYLYWQALGIFLHLGVVWALLRLLLTIHEGWEALGMTAFFAFLFVNTEMVIWQHINSYLIFIICVLVALRHAYLLIREKGTGAGHYISISLWLLMGALTNEIVNGIALAMGAVLWKMRPQQRLWTLGIFAVPFIYAMLNLANLFLHHCTITLYARGGGSRMISDWFMLVGGWLYTGLFPFEFHWLCGPRTAISPDELLVIKPLHLWSLATGAALAMTGIYGAIALKYKRAFRSPEYLVVAMALICNALLALIIDAGRGGQFMMIQIFHIDTYYMYIFWTFMTVALYALVDWAAVDKKVLYLLGIFTAAFILINACKLYAFNDEIARHHLQDMGWLQRVEAAGSSR